MKKDLEQRTATLVEFLQNQPGITPEHQQRRKRAMLEIAYGSRLSYPPNDERLWSYVRSEKRRKHLIGGIIGGSAIIYTLFENSSSGAIGDWMNISIMGLGVVLPFALARRRSREILYDENGNYKPRVFYDNLKKACSEDTIEQFKKYLRTNKLH